MIYTTVRWNVRSFALIIAVSILISGCKPSAVVPPKTTGSGTVPEKAVETTNKYSKLQPQKMNTLHANKLQFTMKTKSLSKLIKRIWRQLYRTIKLEV